MQARDIVTLVINGLFMIGLFVLVGIGRITWTEAGAGLSFLFAHGVTTTAVARKVAPTILGALLLVSVSGCGLLPPKEASEVENAGAAIGCAIERVELDDPALNAVCDQILAKMSPQVQAAAKSAAMTRKASRPVTKTCTTTEVTP